jgi:NTP pyrophosphatase (non-canonical NTP hydrolase)
MKTIEDRTRSVVVKALALYGEDYQVQHIIEELAELVVVLSRYQNKKRVSLHDIRQEIADVTLCMASAACIFEGPKVAAAIEKKLARYEKRVELRLREKRIDRGG